MKKENLKQIKNAKADFVQWYPCPYCKKIIMSGSKEYVKALEEWKNQQKSR